MELVISEDLRSELPLLDRSRYRAGDLTALFERLREAGNRYCGMFYREIPFEAQAAARFVQPLQSHWGVGKRSRWNIKAGCWNFYQMNDRNPAADFELVRRLYPAPAYDCYAVGLMQPYIMHNTLDCASLTVLDFDWRIQEVHWQLLQRVQGGAFEDASGVPAALSSISLAWMAYSGKRPALHTPARADIFCPRATADQCVAALVRFQETFQALERVQLNLASLHLVDFTPAVAAPRVLYLSNAIEENYTAWGEFQTLLRRLTEALQPGESAVLIHHVGGFPEFGLYELTRVQDSYTLRARCRDAYISHPRIKGGGGAYETWFERVAVNEAPPPTCQALLASP